MATDRKLIDYIPPFLQIYEKLATIMGTEQPEIDGLRAEVENVFADQFIMELTPNGAKRWETMLGISPKDTDTLGERRFRILSKQNTETPYTLRKLEQVLTKLCGANGYVIELKAEIYHIEVKLAVGNHNNYLEVKNILNRMIPANMTCHIDLLYNSNAVLSKMTHAQLSAYTHDRLRNEVFN